MFVTHKHFAVLILPVLLLPKLTNFWTVILHEIGVWLNLILKPQLAIHYSPLMVSNK